MKRILVDGRYIENGVYHYYLQDHLGNNRVVAKADGTVVQTNHYYPFGMAFAEGVQNSNQPFKYNGKELDTERGLNLYDYVVRCMDATLPPLMVKCFQKLILLGKNQLEHYCHYYKVKHPNLK